MLLFFSFYSHFLIGNSWAIFYMFTELFTRERSIDEQWALTRKVLSLEVLVCYNLETSTNLNYRKYTQDLKNYHTNQNPSTTKYYTRVQINIPSTISHAIKIKIIKQLKQKWATTERTYIKWCHVTMCDGTIHRVHFSKNFSISKGCFFHQFIEVLDHKYWITCTICNFDLFKFFIAPQSSQIKIPYLWVSSKKPLSQIAHESISNIYYI